MQLAPRGWALSALVVMMAWTAVVWVLRNDIPVGFLALGYWAVTVVLAWGRFWNGRNLPAHRSLMEVRRRAMLDALLVAVTFAPSIVMGAKHTSPIFVVPASLDLALHLAGIILASQWRWVLTDHVVFPALSMGAVWILSFLAIEHRATNLKDPQAERPHSRADRDVWDY